VGYPTLINLLSESEFIFELLNDAVTLACGYFQFPAIYNLHCTSDVIYKSVFLHHGCCQAHGGSVRTHHGRNEIVGDRKHS